MSEEKNKVKPPVKKKKPIKNLNVGINEFGELTSSIKFDDINAFLNDNVKDRKLDEKKEKEKAAKKKKWVLNVATYLNLRRLEGKRRRFNSDVFIFFFLNTQNDTLKKKSCPNVSSSNKTVCISPSSLQIRGFRLESNGKVNIRFVEKFCCF